MGLVASMQCRQCDRSHVKRSGVTQPIEIITRHASGGKSWGWRSARRDDQVAVRYGQTRSACQAMNWRACAPGCSGLRLPSATRHQVPVPPPYCACRDRECSSVWTTARRMRMCPPEMVPIPAEKGKTDGVEGNDRHRYWRWGRRLICRASVRDPTGEVVLSAWPRCERATSGLFQRESADCLRIPPPSSQRQQVETGMAPAGNQFDIEDSAAFRMASSQYGIGAGRGPAVERHVYADVVERKRIIYATPARTSLTADQSGRAGPRASAQTRAGTISVAPDRAP